MKKSKLPVFEITSLIIGEIIVSLIVCAVYLVINKFSYTVVTGAALGSAITVLNFLALSLIVNKTIDKIVAERGDCELTDEDAEQFAAQNKMRVQNAMRISFIVRNIIMVAALVAAFLLPSCFDVIATLIPLVSYRIILMVAGMIKRKTEVK
ncbi:MAG: hypothetical protein J6Q68_01340 [Clostridia bacterium]|nr:hypothetical protein [Clostridia bacterium]